MCKNILPRARCVKISSLGLYIYPPLCRQACWACLIQCRSNESLNPWNPWNPWILGLFLIGTEGSEGRFTCMARAPLFQPFFDTFSKSDFEHPLALILSKMSPKWTPRRSKMESILALFLLRARIPETLIWCTGIQYARPRSFQNPKFSSFLQLRFWVCFRSLHF